MNDHTIQFGTVSAKGQVTNVRLIKQSDIAACPQYIMVPTHYRPDGSCKCDDATERAMMIREWGYSPDSFKGPTRAAEREHVASFDDGFCCCYVGTGGHCPTCHGEEANS